MAQALARRVDEKQDRPAWMVAHRRNDESRHRQRQLDTRFGMIGRTDHRNHRVAASSGAGQEIGVRDDIVAAGEETQGNVTPIHDRDVR
jgi:hypothetical protein